MARKSKYDVIGEGSEQKWRAAIYIRLSKEDGDKEESDSIVNQKILLEDYADNCELAIHDVYIDDGYTGTNFERPDFKRMMDDIKAKLVNCVIVKDLSRFGRNYIEVGNYIEQIFPFMDVRFISVNDTLDSYKNPAQLNNIIVPFKNLMNDEYSRDISIKIRSSLKAKKKRGEFIGSFAPYGYLKDPQNKNKLIIDEETAPVVKNIFEWYNQGLGKTTIAKKLNGLGVPNPTFHKKNLGLNYQLPKSGKFDNPLWGYSSVARILQNEVYIGNLVQSKHQIKSYKIQKLVKTKREDWDIVENTHEPIIDIDTWNKTRGLLSRDLRVSPTESKLSLLAGFVKCADCGRAMNKKNISQPYADYSYYVCGTYKKMGKNNCTKHTVRVDKIEKLLLLSIQRHIEIAVSIEEVIAEIIQSTERNRNNKRIETAVNKKQSELDKIQKLKKCVYEDWKLGELTREEYAEYKSQYENDEKTILKSMETLFSEKKKFAAQINENNIWIQSFKKHKNITSLNREILIELLDKVLVHEGGDLTFVFKFADEFKLLTELIYENRGLVEFDLGKVDNL
jgi:DNA invertase Pin-like site-specific DNA recombinase